MPDSGSPIGELTEGNSRSALVGKFFDSAKPACNYSFYVALIHWGDGTSSNGTVTCETTPVIATVATVPTGTWDVSGSHVYKDSGTYTVSLEVSDDETGTTSGAAVNTTTATVSEANITYDDYQLGPTDGKAVEGATVSVGAAFFDENGSSQHSFDPGVNGTITWGDGSALQTVVVATPPDSCNCLGDVWIAGSHVYDAKKGDGSYLVTIKINDDGGSTDNTTMSLRVSDGKVTAGTPAKSVAAVATQASSPVVASFADAAGAQAAAADFTSSINWGDNSTSAGTVTKTAAGAFNVSGTHTYAAAGNRTLTITVTDEEGQTLSMTASSTVGAAPVVLPNTGQPKAPVTPTSPLLTFALVLLALASGIGGLIRLRANR